MIRHCVFCRRPIWPWQHWGGRFPDIFWHGACYRDVER